MNDFLDQLMTYQLAVGIAKSLESAYNGLVLLAKIESQCMQQYSEVVEKGDPEAKAIKIGKALATKVVAEAARHQENMEAILEGEVEEDFNFSDNFCTSLEYFRKSTKEVPIMRYLVAIKFADFAAIVADEMLIQNPNDLHQQLKDETARHNTAYKAYQEELVPKEVVDNLEKGMENG